MDEPLEGSRIEGKRDRLARFYRVLRILQAHGESGVHVEEVARRVGMSKRTVYRDLVTLETELGVPVWSDGHGTWGVEAAGFLPPLKLTLQEAMAVVLSARLMARYADEYDPDLAAAFQKLEEGLPPVLADHVERTLTAMADRPVDVDHRRHVHLLTKAWAERRIVEFTYAPARYAERIDTQPRRARVRPYLLEPSLVTHALYLIGFDETRDAVRTFKVDRIAELVVTPDAFEAPDRQLEKDLAPAWDIIADQTPVDVVLRFRPNVATRVGEATWHPSQRVESDPDGSLVWRARVAGTIEIRLWILSWGDDVEVLEPAALRDDVAATMRRALERYG
jgi:predicted DNA-binding transcriptional regulator YafY